MQWYTIADNPLISAVVTLTGLAVGSAVVILARIAIRFGNVESDLKSLTRDIKRMVDDKDIVRWSELAKMSEGTTTDLMKRGRV